MVTLFPFFVFATLPRARTTSAPGCPGFFESSFVFARSSSAEESQLVALALGRVVMELAVIPELMADVDEDKLSTPDVETDGLRRRCSQFCAMHLVRSYLRPSKLPTQLMREGGLCITDADGAGGARWV
jgi:hypothetical protein